MNEAALHADMGPIPLRTAAMGSIHSRPRDSLTPAVSPGPTAATPARASSPGTTRGQSDGPRSPAVDGWDAMRPRSLEGPPPKRPTPADPPIASGQGRATTPSSAPIVTPAPAARDSSTHEILVRSFSAQWFGTAGDPRSGPFNALLQVAAADGRGDLAVWALSSIDPAPPAGTMPKTFWRLTTNRLHAVEGIFSAFDEQTQAALVDRAINLALNAGEARRKDHYDRLSAFKHLGRLISMMPLGAARDRAAALADPALSSLSDGDLYAVFARGDLGQVPSHPIAVSASIALRDQQEAPETRNPPHARAPSHVPSEPPATTDFEKLLAKCKKVTISDWFGVGRLRFHEDRALTTCLRAALSDGPSSVARVDQAVKAVVPAPLHAELWARFAQTASSAAATALALAYANKAVAALGDTSDRDHVLRHLAHTLPADPTRASELAWLLAPVFADAKGSLADRWISSLVYARLLDPVGIEQELRERVRGLLPLGVEALAALEERLDARPGRIVQVAPLLCARSDAVAEAMRNDGLEGNAPMVRIAMAALRAARPEDLLPLRNLLLALTAHEAAELVQAIFRDQALAAAVERLTRYRSIHLRPGGACEGGAFPLIAGLLRAPVTLGDDPAGRAALDEMDGKVWWPFQVFPHEFERAEVHGRTLHAESGRALKLSKAFAQCELCDEAARAPLLRQYREELGLESAFPRPLAQFETVVPNKVRRRIEKAARARRVNLELARNPVYALLFEAPAGYQIFLHEIQDLDELRTASRTCVADAARLAREKGFVSRRPADLYHNREDARTFAWNAEARSMGGQTGRLDGGLKKLQHPNFGKGLRDPKHFDFLNSMLKGDEYGHDPMLTLTSETGKFLFCWALALCARFYPAERVGGVSAESKAQLTALLREGFDTYFTVYSGRDPEACRAFLDRVLDVGRLIQEADYILSGDYVQDVARDRVREGVYGEGVQVSARKPKSAWDKKFGWAIHPPVRDLGPYNGPFPIPELIRSLYLVTYFSAWLRR